MDISLLKAFIAGQVRHVISGAGAILVAYGAIKQGQTDAFVEIATGIVIYLLGAAWSAIQKWRAAGKPPVPPTVARVLPLLLVLPLLGGTIAGCTPEERAKARAAVRAVIVKMNSGVATIDDVAHELCRPGDFGEPGLIQRLSSSTTLVACIRDASGESQDRIARVVTFGEKFCANKTAENLAQMMKYAAAGLAAASSAKAAKCDTVQ